MLIMYEPVFAPRTDQSTVRLRIDSCMTAGVHRRQPGVREFSPTPTTGGKDMSPFQLVALAIVILFFALTFWGFSKATPERVRILGTVGSLAGVALGFLFQEPRVQESQLQAAESRERAAVAIDIAADANERLVQVERVLAVNQPPGGGGQVALPADQAIELQELIRSRPDIRRLKLDPQPRPTPP